MQVCQSFEVAGDWLWPTTACFESSPLHNCHHATAIYQWSIGVYDLLSKY